MKATEVTFRTTISDKDKPRLTITLHRRNGVVDKMEHTLYVKGVPGAGKIPLTARHLLDAVAESVVHYANAGVDIEDAKFGSGLFAHINEIRNAFSVHAFEIDLLKK